MTPIPLTRSDKDPIMTHHAVLSALFVALAATAAIAQPAPPPASQAMPWQTHLDRMLIDTASKRAQFGGCVIELPSGRVIYERNSTTPLMPASNMKLMVIAAAIDTLGKSYQFNTTLAIAGKDIVIVGGGDPVLGDDRLAPVLQADPHHAWRLEGLLANMPRDLDADSTAALRGVIEALAERQNGHASPAPPTTVSAR